VVQMELQEGGMLLEQRAFQDRFEWENRCWGCGSLNEHGLQIKSYWQGDEAVCTWQPKQYHSGPPDALNGGIIATIIDCHCACTAVAAAYRAEGREIGTEPRIWFASASLQVTYLQPTATTELVVLRARVKEQSERKTVVTCSLFAKGEECARGEVVAVRVPASWYA
jgi:acyl-coenzyme A thioesterase PaaI-like protein